jgi:hypothetical protein
MSSSWTADSGSITADSDLFTADGGASSGASMANTNIVPQGVFGPGILILTRTDVANATPINAGFVQEFSTDIKLDLKELYGQNHLPLLVARGTGKCSGKIKAAVVSAQVLNTVLFGAGGTLTPTEQYDFSITAATAIPATPFQVTPTVPSTGTFDKDLGVINAATGEPMTLVTGTPAAGQYAVNSGTGVYTFSSADNVSGVQVIITFAYHFTAGAAGQVLTINNEPIGTTPTFQIDYKSTLYGATYYLRLFNCVGGGWAMGHKLTDFASPEFDFSFFANAAQQLGFISLATAA